MYTVYIVDDDPMALEQLGKKSDLFAECGFEICGMQTNPLLALEEIREAKPNVVLSDLKMPVLSGVDLFRTLREDVHSPIFVIVSAYSDFSDVRKFLVEYKGFDYILKPIEDNELADLLNRFAEEIGGTPPLKTGETISPELNQILDYLKENPGENHSLAMLGDRFHLSPNSISRLFSKHLGLSFRSHITALRMALAEELLRTTDLPVKEICARCGYESYFYFIPLYEKTYGVTPTKYRRSLYEE
jgi:YesN/AraC family two-component response regulator